MARVNLFQTSLSDSTLKLAYLIEIQFDDDGTPAHEYITDFAHDLLYNGDTYEAQSHLLKTASVNETNQLKVSSYTIELSAVSQEYVAILLTKNWMNRKLIIKRAFLDANNGIDGVYTVFEGLLSNFDISENKDKAIVKITAQSHWADFERVTGRRTNQNSQQFYFPNDTGFKYSADSIKDLKWGK